MQTMALEMDWALKGAILLVVAGGLALVLRRASASWKHLIWSVAMVSLALLPAWSIWGPALRLPVLALDRASDAWTMNLPMSEPAGQGVVGAALAGAMDPDPGVAAAVPLSAISAVSVIRWDALFAVVWLVGVLVVLVPWAIGQWRIRRMNRERWTAGDGVWEPWVNEVRGRLGLSREVRVFEHSGPGMPMTWGFWRPAILLPLEARDWDDDRKLAVLSHELAHVQRFDCLTRAIGRVGLAMHWFNPLAWVAIRRMRLESEQACDDRALAVGADPAEYADLLLGLARRLRTDRWAGTAAITMARSSQLEGRLLAILDAARDRTGVTRRGVLAILVAAATLLGPISSIRLTARAGDGDPSDTGSGREAIHETDAEVHGFSLRPVGDPPEMGEGSWMTGAGESESERFWILDEVVADGSHIAAVEAQKWDERSYEISVTFSEAGAIRLDAWTGAHLNRRLAVVLDGRVLSAPTVRARISGGKVMITGRGPLDETLRLVQALNDVANPPAGADASSLQQRIDAARRPGQVIDIPAGTYREPLRITRPVTLRGANAALCQLKVTADAPAIWITGDIEVRVEGLAIQWERATSQVPDGIPLAAVAVQDADLTLTRCQLSAESGPARSPCAVMVSGFGDSTVSECGFDGFDYTIQFWGGPSGKILDNVLMNPGHCGITAGRDARLEIARNLVTGSAFHGIRCTGGQLLVEDNLVVQNANRGIYLGNRRATGAIRNNILLANATGIGSFADSDVAIEHNLILDSTYAGVGSRDTCRLQLGNNILRGNQRGIVMFEEGGRVMSSFTASNQLWDNAVPAEGFPLPESTIETEPAIGDPADWRPETLASWPTDGPGLANPAALAPLWEKWMAIQSLQED